MKATLEAQKAQITALTLAEAKRQVALSLKEAEAKALSEALTALKAELEKAQKKALEEARS